MSFKKHLANYVFNVGKKVSQTLSGQGKTTGKEVIKNIKIAPNLDTKRAIQDKVVKTVDSAFKKADLPPSVRSSIETKNKKAALKRDEGKKLKNISYKLDKLEEKVKGKKFNKGGRVGLKFGSRKSNVQKIKETFGPGKNNPKKSTAKKKKFPDLTGDGKVTFADILKGRGVKRG